LLDCPIQEDGGQRPQGVKLLGRWTPTDFSGGYFLLENENAGALTELALQWSDLIEVELAPVVDDKAVTRGAETGWVLTAGLGSCQS
jgi:hypothetical protein